MYNSIRITGVARTLANLMDIPAPEHAAPAIDTLLHAAGRAFSGRGAERVLVYNPDAIAMWLYQKYTAMFEEAILHSDIQLPMLSVMPSVTPVCFASMYTGAMPDIHGIREYIKPVLRTDTLFDAAIRAGKKVAIVSAEGASMSLIFLERDMDYFIFETSEECNEKALKLLAQDRHDLIALYNPNYDFTMHRNGPEAEVTLSMLQKNIETYGALVRAAQTHWQGRRVAIGFCPDHGCHAIDGNLGSHGLDMPEDMNIIHFYRFLSA